MSRYIGLNYRKRYAATSQSVMLVGIRVKTELYWNNLSEDKWIWEWAKNKDVWTGSNRGPIGGAPGLLGGANYVVLPV